MEDSFGRELKKLNPGQREAVETIEGPVMVVAGPGTGKTQVLTLRIGNILQKTQVEPENILALTFTESASQNMRARLAELIGTPAYRVEIATFHGFANRLIQSHPEEFPGLVGAEAITELEQVEILEKIIVNGEYNLLRPFGDPLYYVKSVLGVINELKREGMTYQRFAEAVAEQKKNFGKIDDLYHEKGKYKGLMKGKYVELEKSIEKNEELVKAFESYQKELSERRFYDFADMLIEVLAVMEKKSGLLSGLQERYQYILVDEHQDTNSAQNRIIELLASYFAPNPNLFVVGDEKQAIFRFQGATVENFLYFKKLYPDAKLIHLTENYRSSQRILDASGSLIRKNPGVDVIVEQGSYLTAQNKLPDEKIQVVSLKEEWMENEWLAEKIESLLQQGTKAEEIAIIVRQNRDFEDIGQVLSRKGIRFNISANENVLADKWVDQLLTILRAVWSYDFDPSVNSDWLITRVMHFEIFGVDPMSIYRLLKERARRRISLIELLDDNEGMQKLHLKDLEKVTQMVNQLKVWVALANNETLDNMFVKVFCESMLRERVLGLANSFEVLNKFKQLFDDLKNQLSKNKTMTLGDYIKYLDLLKAHNLGIENKNETFMVGAVRMMTAHKSKGLEFDVVLMPKAAEGHWGNGRKRGLFKLPWEELGVKLLINAEIDEIDDERRLFYVGLTRARQEIYISYSKLSSEGREQLPCQFISEIDEDHKEKLEVNKFENEAAQHLERIFTDTADDVGEENREYIKDLFVAQGLSATSLDNYLECPWKYFYRNLLQLPDIKSKSMIFGSAVHSGISKFIDALKLGERPTLETVQRAAIDYLKKESLTEKDFNELVNRCNKTLGMFYEVRMQHWDSMRESELRIRGVKLSEEVSINGVIDMIEPIDDGEESNQVRVTDFKTGRVKSRTEISKEGGDYNYERQLRFYKLLLDNYQYKRMVVAEGVIDFVEPDNKGNLHREVFVIDKNEVEDLKKVIMGVADEIINLKFWNRYCDQEDCEYCRMRKLVVDGRG